MRKALLCLTAGAFINSVSAQTLFTFGSHPVSKDEFVRVYQKNSINKKTDFSAPAVREYLDLYSLFKMKVQEAELQKLDTVSTVALELNNYHRQLARNYMTDRQVTDRLVKEAYERGKNELRVQHILIAVPAGASPADTLILYRRADSVYKAVTKGKADFGATATAITDDKGNRPSGGDIGYMTVLQTIYPFENAAYTTPVGQIHTPFRTNFGYHIIKVNDKRAAKGQVQVAQILIATPKAYGPEGIELARKKMTEVQAELKKGASFEAMVKKYSEDKFSNTNNGVLEPFGSGRYEPAFEDAAFGLKNPGDVSKPIETEYGIHLLKLISKTPALPFDSVKEALQRKIENDSRAAVARDEYLQSVKKNAGFKAYPEALLPIEKRIQALPDTGAKAGVYSLDDFKGMNAPLFKMGNKTYTQQDYLEFLTLLTRGRVMGPRGTVVNDVYRMFEDRTINDYQEERLAEENPEFRNLMEEYTNGILLFELMDRSVWTKAGKDSVGLKAFYEKYKDHYKWAPGFEGLVYHFKDKAALDLGLPLLKAGKLKDEDFMKKINTDTNPDAVTVTKGHFEFSKFTDVPQAGISKSKLSEPVKMEDGAWVVVKADEVFNNPTTKTLDEARGYVVAEYQDFLEKEWNKRLREKYPVKVDEKVLSTIIK